MLSHLSGSFHSEPLNCSLILVSAACRICLVYRSLASQQSCYSSKICSQCWAGFRTAQDWLFLYDCLLKWGMLTDPNMKNSPTFWAHCHLSRCIRKNSKYFEIYESSAHILNLSDFITTKIELPFVKGVGKLGRLLDKLCCDFHSIINTMT